MHEGVVRETDAGKAHEGGQRRHETSDLFIPYADIATPSINHTTTHIFASSSAVFLRLHMVQKRFFIFDLT